MRVKERTNGQWVRDVLDRSGALAWLSPYAAGIEKATGLGAGGSTVPSYQRCGRSIWPILWISNRLRYRHKRAV